MFDDMPEDVDGFEVSADSSDRELLYAIWTRNEIGDLPADEAWSILFERYPDEVRFLLLNAYEEQMQPSIPGVWTPLYFSKKAIRILDESENLAPRVRDLVIAAWSSLFDPATARKLSASMDGLLKRVDLSVKRPPSEEESEEAHARLDRFASEILKEMHDKTRDGGLIGSTPKGSKKPATDYVTMVREGKGPPTKYQPSAKYELGSLVEHAKFGLGVVTSIESNRVELLFEDGARKLVCG